MSTLKNKNSVKTIEAGGQLCKNLRTMRLGQNLLVLIKKKACIYSKVKMPGTLHISVYFNPKCTYFDII